MPQILVRTHARTHLIFHFVRRRMRNNLYTDKQMAIAVANSISINASQCRFN